MQKTKVQKSFFVKINELKEKYKNDDEAIHIIGCSIETINYYLNLGDITRIKSDIANLEAFLHDWY